MSGGIWEVLSDSILRNMYKSPRQVLATSIKPLTTASGTATRFPEAAGVGDWNVMDLRRRTCGLARTLFYPHATVYGSQSLASVIGSGWIQRQVPCGCPTKPLSYLSQLWSWIQLQAGRRLE